MSSNKTPNYNLHIWEGTDLVKREEFNENFNTLDAALKPTADPSQVPNGNVGKIAQWMSWLTNRIQVIVGKTNWWDAPDITLVDAKSHVDATAPHSGHETPAGAQAKADAAEAAANVYTDQAVSAIDAELTALENDVMSHKAESAPHSGHEKTANKGVANGYASLDAEGKVPVSQIHDSFKEIKVVNNIAERDALLVYSGLKVHVIDASADASVGSGWAEYIWNGTQWTKTSEAESLDIVLDWANIQNKPNAAQIPIVDSEAHFTATDTEGALHELFTSVSSGKSDIASAITDMGQTASGSDSFAILSNKIRTISTDATATAGDILSGKTAYVNGVKVTGTLTSTKAVLSDTIRYNSNTYAASINGTDSTSWVKAIEIQVNVDGDYRVQWKLSRGGFSYAVYSELRINGTTVASSSTNSSYIKTYDAIGLKTGDILSIWCKSSIADTSWIIDDVYLKFDYSHDPEPTHLYHYV